MISGYINENSGSTQFSVYNYGEMVIAAEESPWPIPLSTSSYYLRWLPSYISSGQFYVFDSVYNFSDYLNGVFYFSSGFSGYWGYSYYNPQTFRTDSNIVSSPYITYFETNIKGIRLNPMLNCPNLSMANMSCCEYITYYTYAYERTTFICGDGNPVRFSLPVCYMIGSYAFWGNGSSGATYISSINLPVCIQINQAAFGGVNITLEYSSVCSLAGPTYSPYTRGGIGGTGSSLSCRIYVPSSLVSAYKSAHNWSYWSSRIFPIPS